MADGAIPTLPCIVCGVVLMSALPDGSDNQPASGTAFFTHGHYGSTVFDPMDNSWLEINICDSCLIDHAQNQEILLRKGDDHAEYWRKPNV